MSLAGRLDKIRSSPKLQNQQQTALVLSAVEDTLRSQAANPSATPTTAFTPTEYFAVLLSLLSQYVTPAKGIVNKDVSAAVVYLLDLVTPEVPAALLRDRFSQILSNLAPALTHSDADAPLLRSSIGVLENILLVQNAAAWELGQAQVSPRRAVAGLLAIAVDHRPKVRKRAQEALTKVLKNPPPSPSLDHPAADMCAEGALKALSDLVEAAARDKKSKSREANQHDPSLVHALQLVKTIASASGGWPSRKIDGLCELLLNVSRSSSEYLTMAAFEVFESMFEGMANEVASAKLPRLLDAISELQPASTDTQLLPPWLAVISRAYDVSAQLSPEETFQALPDVLSKISAFMSSPSHNIRVSASKCLVSFFANCIPESVILEPSIFDEKVLEKLASLLSGLLSVRYQTAWMEVFTVLGAAFEALHWRSTPLLTPIIKAVGDLRSNEAFAGKKDADAVLAKAIHAAGPEAVLSVLPLNLAKPVRGEPGRAWLLPLLRDNVNNTELGYFRREMVPLSETMFERVISHGGKERTTDIKIFETVVQQVWSCFPGYCELPLDLTVALDQQLAELTSNLLYQQTQLRTDICRGLQNLVESNQAMLDAAEDDPVLKFTRVSKSEARQNLAHLAQLSGNLLAVLFNVYSQTLPHNRGVLLQCINAYLSITPDGELLDTFTRVTAMLETALQEQKSAATQAEKQKQRKDGDKLPPQSHTLMDLLITLSKYLPRSSYPSLFSTAATIISRDDDSQLQKKAYKLIPRLGESEVGRQALRERNAELQHLLLSSAEKASPPSRRDRLAAIAQIVDHLPSSDLHFIPSILPEVVIATKEVNEKARTAAFDLLVSMGRRMSEGGTVAMSRVPHIESDTPDQVASLEEYLTMISAGLAGTTPHAISASVTACTRVLYEFRSSLPEATIVSLVETVELFLQSKSREIVRSVLGFVKVCVISLPDGIVRPRLHVLTPQLLSWGHEHKGAFKSKVKHIVERMIRRFGVEQIERVCPEEDKKLITNIRKTKERNKRKKAAGGTDAGEDEEEPDQGRGRGAFENEFDEAIYGSSDDESVNSNSDEDEPSADTAGRTRHRHGEPRAHGVGRQRQAYIVEDDDEPLDLLDRRALGNISSTRPLKTPQMKKTKAKTNIDGKLIFNEPAARKKGAGDDADMLEGDADAGGDGTNAYVDAVSSKDAGRRGLRGKIKFNNRKYAAGDDEMEVDEEEFVKARRGGAVQRVGFKARGGGSPRSIRGGGGGAGGMKAARMQRRGLGVEKRREKHRVSGGRVGK